MLSPRKIWSLCALGAAFWALTLVSQAREKPNFIVFLVDELGWADLPWHGSPYQTPNLDKLARGGLHLEANYVHTMCSPTRAALLSGRYASRFGVTAAQNEQAMPFGTPTLASILKARGYATALVGKWHLGSKPEQGPQKFGFDFSYGSLAGGCSQYSHKYKVGEFTDTWHRNGQLITDEGHSTDLIAREAVQWLEARGADEPFFLYIPFTAIHIPMEEPEKWLAFNPGLADPGQRLRGAATSHMDHAMGQILSVVEKRGWSQDTLIVFMGDNGAHQLLNNFDHHFPGEYPDVKVGHENTPYRDYKTSVYEGGIRVGGVAYWPGKIAPGQTDTPTQAPDWLPTLAALAGATVPPGTALDGIDLREVLFNPAKVQPTRVIYSAAPSYRARSVRYGDWKLVVSGKKAGVEKEELFNLKTDQSEAHDVAAENPDILAQMKQRLADVSKNDQPGKSSE